MTRIGIVIFAEGSFEELHHQPTEELAHAFAEGAMAGVRHYGAGDFAAYVMPREENSMREDEAPDEVERAMEAIAEADERDRLNREGTEP